MSAALRSLAALAAAPLCAALALGGAARAQVLGGPEPPPVAWDQRLGERVPLDARFTDQDGRALTLGSLVDGRPVVLALVYYECPMLCTLVLRGLLDALREVGLDAGEDFSVVAVSIDPRETSALAAAKRAACVKAYGRAGGDEGWSFLVGEEPEIRRLADAVGFRYTYVEATDEYAHGAGVSVLTGEGAVSRVLFGVTFEPRDLRLALVEAGQGAIGTPVDRILLRCFHYDPAHGRYGFAILGSLRLAGFLTVGALAGCVLRLLRRERRAAATGGA